VDLSSSVRPYSLLLEHYLIKVGELAFPPSRGSDAAVARIGPCQGFELGGRVEYPLNGGRVSWTATRDIEDITLAYSTNADSTTQDDFTNVAADFGRGYVGSRCVEGPDFEALGFSAGDQVTLQWSFKAGPQKSQSFEVSHSFRRITIKLMIVCGSDLGLAFRLCRPELLDVLRKQDRDYSNEVQCQSNSHPDEGEWGARRDYFRQFYFVQGWAHQCPVWSYWSYGLASCCLGCDVCFPAIWILDCWQKAD
jgi:hypothetical protein